MGLPVPNASTQHIGLGQFLSPGISGTTVKAGPSLHVHTCAHTMHTRTHSLHTATHVHAHIHKHRNTHTHAQLGADVIPRVFSSIPQCTEAVLNPIPNVK